MGYVDTLIAVADDCPAPTAVVPVARGGRRTVAVVQYELVAGQPYAFTQEDVLFETWLRQQDPQPQEDRASLRDRFFDRPRACLRSSPLPKQYGWGIHCDEAGRVALYGVESDRYSWLAAGGASKVLKALRSRRA